MLGPGVRTIARAISATPVIVPDVIMSVSHYSMRMFRRVHKGLQSRAQGPVRRQWSAQVLAQLSGPKTS